jgi:hypothetical protein
MYSRKENIEVENLDWENHVTPSPIRKNGLIEKMISPFTSQKTQQLSIIEEKRDVLDEHLSLFFIFTLLVFPYIVGFFFSYFLFYLYGDMNIIDFFMMQQGHLYIESWGIGMYVLVVSGIIWAVLKSWSGNSKSESL